MTDVQFEEEKSAAFIKADPLVLKFYTNALNIQTQTRDGVDLWNLVDLIEIKSMISSIKSAAYYDGTTSDESALMRKKKR